MLSANRERDSIGGRSLALASPAPARKKPSRNRPPRPRPHPARTGQAALLGLGALLLVGGSYLLWRMGSFGREVSTMRAQMERRMEQLDAGISFDSKRQRLLLSVRDEMMAANRRLAPELAYEYAKHLVTACDKYPAIDPLFFLAIGIAESGFDASATSHAKARGLYQIWPSTGRMLAGMLGWQFTEDMLYEPGKNTALAALYLHILFAAYNDQSLVLAEYNGGPLNAGYLRAGSERVSPETRGYVAKVLALHEGLKRKFGKGDSPVARNAFVAETTIRAKATEVR